MPLGGHLGLLANLKGCRSLYRSSSDQDRIQMIQQCVYNLYIRKVSLCLAICQKLIPQTLLTDQSEGTVYLRVPILLYKQFEQYLIEFDLRWDAK